MSGNYYALVILEQKLEDVCDLILQAYGFCSPLMGTEDLLSEVKHLEEEATLLHYKIGTMRILAERQKEES